MIFDLVIMIIQATTTIGGSPRSQIFATFM